METQKKAKNKSVFDTRNLSDIHKEIQKVYADDLRPWIIGFSGGKIQQRRFNWFGMLFFNYRRKSE